MHQYTARVSWRREGAPFLDHRYSRAHEWEFDGGARVQASSSPLSVPSPMSVEANVDPEEALVAAASSCHMLWFLALAAQRGLTVDSYLDDSFGIMQKNTEGRVAITRITLRPKIEFAGERIPTSTEIQKLHELAHEKCFIANSLKSEIVVEQPSR